MLDKESVMDTKARLRENAELFEQLREVSVACIVQNQDPSGAFIAGPSFSQYQYSWFRDGTYIAYSLLVKGYKTECQRFIEWGALTISRHKGKVEKLPLLLASGEAHDTKWFLGARYTAQGLEDQSDWPNFQIDGYGSWLWLVARYLQFCELDTLPINWRDAVATVIEYLSLVWQLPNSDCWEEFPREVHPATIACVAGGLEAIGPYLDVKSYERNRDLVSEMTGYLYSHRHGEDFFPKHLDSTDVDSSLIWLSVPYGVIPTQDPSMAKTIERIETELLHGGGVQRYVKDTYYGGGLWLPLSGFLGWYYVEVGRIDEASMLLCWIAEQRTEKGFLPEQVLGYTNEPAMIKTWTDRWGSVATPLLWSHAMFLILDYELSRYNHVKGE